MKTETNIIASVMPTISEVNLTTDMTKEFSQKTSMLLETYLKEYCEVNGIAEKDLVNHFQMHYPENECTVQLTKKGDIENVVLQVRIDAESFTTDECYKIKMTMNIGGSLFDEVDKYPRTKALLESYDSTENETGDADTTEGEQSDAERTAQSS